MKENPHIVGSVKHLLALWVFPLPLFKGIPISSILLNWDEVALSRPISRRIFPRWHSPPHGALKLNFDGSVNGNPGMAGVGGFVVLSTTKMGTLLCPTWARQVFAQSIKWSS